MDIISFNALKEIPRDIFDKKIEQQAEKVADELNELILRNWKEGSKNIYTSFNMNQYNIESLTRVVNLLKERGYIVYGPVDHHDSFCSDNDNWSIQIEFPKTDNC
jgi:hypothetical protein